MSRSVFWFTLPCGILYVNYSNNQLALEMFDFTIFHLEDLG